MDTSTIILIIAAVFLGLLLGAVIGWLLTQTKWQQLSEQLRIELAQYKARAAELDQLRVECEKLRSENTSLHVQNAALGKEREALNDKLAWLDTAQAQMREAFEALAGKSLQANTEAFLQRSDERLANVVTPLRENLSFLDKQVRELEVKREGAYKGLEQQLRQLSTTHADLQKTAVSLTQALKSSSGVQGRWGEMQLRRVVEMAGMVKNVSFVEQKRGDNSGQPDMITYLPNGGMLLLDAKASMSAYFDAMAAETEQEKQSKLANHAKAMKDQVRALSQRKYWNQFDQTPEFVVMFIPNDAYLGAAFEFDPELLEFAIQRQVLITTPVTLLALLKAVAYGWQQHQLTENSKKIAEQGKELYQRLSILFDHLEDLRGNLNRTVGSFNKAVGSLESRLLPSARRFEEMGVADGALAAPEPIDSSVRSISAKQ